MSAEEEKCIRTRTRTIIDYAVKHLENKEIEKKLIAPLSYV